MGADNIVKSAETKFKDALNHYNDELKTIRTGRANASMLDGVTVEAYGTPMPLKQVANVIAPDAQLLQITPFDPSNLASISEAIRVNTALGLNPSDDGRVIRLPIPPLTEERRKEIAKQIGEREEDCLVKMRNVRHEAINAVNEFKKDKSIGEDDAKRHIKRIEDIMASQHKAVEESTKKKQQEILTL